MTIVHFVAFTPEQMRRWRCVFGEPHYVHDRWDVRAEQEHADSDVVIYANNTPRRAEERAFFQCLTELNSRGEP